MVEATYRLLSHYGAAIGVGLLVFLLGLERLRPQRGQRGPARGRWKRIARNLGIGVVYRVIAIPLVAAPLLHYALTHQLFVRAPWQRSFWAFAVDFMLLDALNYAMHVAAHKVPILWRFHLVHHLDEHLDASTGVRQHFGEKLLILPPKLLLVAGLAMPVSHLVIFEVFTFCFGMFHHCDIRLPPTIERALGKVISVPSFHVAHHGRRPKYTDSNYGANLTIWDYLFGTVSVDHRADAGADFAIGLDDHRDHGFMDLLLAKVSTRRPSTTRSPDSSSALPTASP